MLIGFALLAFTCGSEKRSQRPRLCPPRHLNRRASILTHGPEAAVAAPRRHSQLGQTMPAIPRGIVFKALPTPAYALPKLSALAPLRISVIVRPGEMVDVSGIM
jgi:hypothetical protein